MGQVKKAMEDACLKKANVHEIVLSGGSTQIPMVQQFLKDYFEGKVPIKSVNLDEVVAYGAAIQGGILSGKGKLKPKVYGCEKSMTKDCQELGRFDLSGVAPAPSSVPQIEVTFEIDANSIRHVEVEDKATKKSKSITSTN